MIPAKKNLFCQRMCVTDLSSNTLERGCVMKRVILSILIGFLGLSSDATALEEGGLATCLINRSIEMPIEVEHLELGYSVVNLYSKMWNSSDRKLEATLNNVMIVEYGRVTTILADHGKSGYAMIRLEKQLGRARYQYKAFIDINLFNSEGPLGTFGHLREVWCH
jgi:hypothetical protein